MIIYYTFTSYHLSYALSTLRPFFAWLCRENEHLTESEITGKSERNRLIEEIQTLVRSREATEKVLESKTSTIQALESELNSQSASQSPLLESMQQQIRESNHEISDLTQSVESLQLALLKKEEDHKNILKDKDNELKQLKAIIAAKEEKLIEMEKDMLSKEGDAKEKDFVAFFVFLAGSCQLVAHARCVLGVFTRVM